MNTMNTPIKNNLNTKIDKKPVKNDNKKITNNAGYMEELKRKLKERNIKKLVGMTFGCWMIQNVTTGGSAGLTPCMKQASVLKS